MARPFEELRERLLRGGVAPRHVRRYLGELRDHLADLRAEEELAGRGGAEAEGAALARLGSVEDLAGAMMEQRQFQSWCARAPWAVFGFGPVVSLAGAYAVACVILWSGWNVFLPGASTPFVRIHGLAVLFFGVGRLIYFGAPVFAGWAVGVVAARQRLGAVWPMVGLVLVALMGGAAQVHVARAGVNGGAKLVSMSLDVGSFCKGAGLDGRGGLVPLLSPGALHALLILPATVLPYLIWRLKKTQSLSA